MDAVWVMCKGVTGERSVGVGDMQEGYRVMQ